MEEVDTYVVCIQNTVSKFIATKSIMDLFLAVERRHDVRLYQRWWEHENLDLEARQAIANAVEVTDMKGMEEDEDKKV